MSSFYVYKRGKYYYARLKNTLTGQWTTAKSTGKTDKNEAIYMAMGWLQGKIPLDRTQQKRDSSDFFQIDALLNQIKNAPLAAEDAQKIISCLVKKGFIENYQTRKESHETLTGFLDLFWDYDDSPYIRERLAHGHRITRAHAKNNMRNIHRYWHNYFSDKLLIDVTRQDLKDFSIWLAERYKTRIKNGKVIELDEKLSHETLNKVLRAGTVAIKWLPLRKRSPMTLRKESHSFPGTVPNGGF